MGASASVPEGSCSPENALESYCRTRVGTKTSAGGQGYHWWAIKSDGEFITGMGPGTIARLCDARRSESCVPPRRSACADGSMEIDASQCLANRKLLNVCEEVFCNDAHFESLLFAVTVLMRVCNDGARGPSRHPESPSLCASPRPPGSRGLLGAAQRLRQVSKSTFGGRGGDGIPTSPTERARRIDGAEVLGQGKARRVSRQMFLEVPCFEGCLTKFPERGRHVGGKTRESGGRPTMVQRDGLTNPPPHSNISWPPRRTEALGISLACRNVIHQPSLASKAPDYRPVPRPFIQRKNTLRESNQITIIIWTPANCRF